MSATQAPPERQGADDAPVWQVRVQAAPGRSHSFAAPARRSLLLAAQDAGLRLPSSCRNGSCRACMCRLLQGRISYLVEWPGLLADEKAEGWILPCVALAESDLVIEQTALRPV
jgi:ferredoxin